MILRCFWALCLAFMITPVPGQSADGGYSAFTVSKRLLSIEDGLASHEVFCGLQDQAGFIWFGTRNGLNRYDGKTCLLFTRQRNSLQDNKVVQLALDGANNLFIEYGSTGFQLNTNGKVDVLNLATQEVKTLSAAFPDMPFKEQDVYWLSDDGTGQINFLTAFPFRLWKYTPGAGFRLRYQVDNWGRKDSIPIADYHTTGPFCLFAKGKALLKIFNQSAQYLVSDDTVITFTQKDALRSLPIGFNKQGDLLITYNTQKTSGSFELGTILHSGAALFPANEKDLGGDSIKGKYWYQAACSSDGSAGILDIATDGLYLWSDHTFLKVPGKPEIKAFENLFLYKLFSDRLGNLWLCTSLGVLQLRIAKNRFKHYFTSRQQTVEANSQARGIYADESANVTANVWMHTFSQHGPAISFASDYEIKYALVRHHGALYCGGFNLYLFDTDQNKLIKIPGGGGSEIWSMFSLNDSLLIMGRTNGFSLYNSNSRTFSSPFYISPNTPDAKFVYRFLKDSTGLVWAVAENGLFKINRDGKRWSVAAEPSPVVHELSLLDAYSDNHGIFWLATNGEGLFRWDRKTNSFRQFNIANGFPSDVLYRIEPDEFNNLWISSDYGLIRFNKKNFSVNSYSATDGISHNEFNRTSSFKAENGRLYFGGLDGINALDPGDFITDTNTLDAPLRIISCSQYVGAQNGLVNKTIELANTSQIKLEPGDPFFTIEFRLLDFAKEESRRYAYRIEGVDKDWNYNSVNSIRISGLPYGKFTLRVKAQDREGAWSKSELNIQLIVLKPFYLQWWFLGLLALLFALSVFWIIKWRTRQLAADKNKLELTVSERTGQLKQSLAAQAALLADKDVLMKEIHHRVKNNLQVISGLLELQGKGLDNETAKNALREGRNRVRSIALIHQNLYQFDNLNNIELKQFVHDLCRQVESVYRKKNKITVNIQVPLLYLDIDTAVPLGLIMNELLSNSFKYAFDDVTDGEISLEIHTMQTGRYELLYSDNGPGLPADFNLRAATTLGMQLINDLARQIGGNVQYRNINRALFAIQFTNRSQRKKED